jgi:Sap-like sulfolipid-1-addressing protein
VQTLIASVAGLGIAVAASSLASVIAVLILLELPGGLRRAAAFVTGWIVMIGVFALVLELFPSLDYRSSRSTPSRISSGVEVAIGCGLVAWAVVLYRRPRPDTPKDPIPAWLTHLLSKSWVLSAAAGALMLTYSLTAVAVLEALKAHVSRLDRLLAMLVFGATSILTISAPIIYTAAAPDRAANALASARRWLTLNWVPISAMLLGLVGTLIVLKAGFDLAS